MNFTVCRTEFSSNVVKKQKLYGIWSSFLLLNFWNRTQNLTIKEEFTLNKTGAWCSVIIIKRLT